MKDIEELSEEWQDGTLVGGIETLKMVGSMVGGTNNWGCTTCSA
jgi:hypothetical protein